MLLYGKLYYKDEMHQHFGRWNVTRTWIKIFIWCIFPPPATEAFKGPNLFKNCHADDSLSFVLCYINKVALPLNQLNPALLVLYCI